MDENGEIFKEDLKAGDVWFFLAGLSHFIQTKENECEFLLVFNNSPFIGDNNSKEQVIHLPSLTPTTLHCPGDTIKIIDSLKFPILTNISAIIFTIKPGVMRKMHWRTIGDE
jgi:hypothetical protein